jgi:hypothetical protein
MADWTKAVFLGESSPGGPQQWQVYQIQVNTPGQLYPYQVLIQELPGCTDEYLDLARVQQEWQLDRPPGPPRAAGLSAEEADDFYQNGHPLDGTFSDLGEDHDDI